MNKYVKGRISQLQGMLADINVDAFLVTSAVNHRYYTDFNNDDGTLLITNEKCYAFEDFRYFEEAQRSFGDVYTIFESVLNEDKLNEIIAKDNIKRIGFEGGRLSYSRHKRLSEELKAELVSFPSLLEGIRDIKDPVEIERIAIAQEITDGAFAHIIKMITPTMTENDVAAELEYYMRKHGAEDKSFETIAVSGQKSSIPHGVPSDTRLKKGFLTMDFGAVYEGYHSDMTRTVCIGKADDEMKKLYNTVLKAQMSALDMLRDGVVCADADKVARDIIEVDYKGCFGHSLGHGVGLEIHESPNLSAYNKKPLAPGNIVTVEPGIYIAGKYGCRIEDMVLIQEGNIRNFTKSPKELIEIY